MAAQKPGGNKYRRTDRTTVKWDGFPKGSLQMKMSFLHWLLGDTLTPDLLVIKYSSMKETCLFLANLGTSCRHLICFLHLQWHWFLGALGTHRSHWPWAETQTAPRETGQQHFCSSFQFSRKKNQNFLKNTASPKETLLSQANNEQPLRFSRCFAGWTAAESDWAFASLDFRLLYPLDLTVG